MKRWRTDGADRRAATALAFLVGAVALGWPNAGRAESQAAVAAGFSQEKLARVGDYIRNEVATGKIPGAVILIQQHGKPVYFENFGVRDLESKRPMTADTIFRLYSMSKPITSVAAMMLVEDGKLSLDDPVSKYIPAFADLKVGVEKRGDSGTPQLALEPRQPPDHHRGPAAPHLGPHLRLLWRQRGAETLCAIPTCSTAISTTREFAERIAKLPLAEQPGTLWDYGHSTDVLGRVIEVVSGQSLFAVRKAASARSAGDDRYRVLRRGCGEAATDRRADAGRPLSQSRRRHTAIRCCRGAGNPAAPAWSAPSAITRGSRKCC